MLERSCDRDCRISHRLVNYVSMTWYESCDCATGVGVVIEFRDQKSVLVLSMAKELISWMDDSLCNQLCAFG